MGLRSAVSFLILLISIVHAQDNFSNLDDGTEPSTTNAEGGTNAQDLNCDGNIHFELITGYVYSSAEDIIDSMHGTLRVEECIDICRETVECRAVNFETGLCILFSSAAGENSASLAVSQLPVFTLYAQKVCLPLDAVRSPWTYETTPELSLIEGYIRDERSTTSRRECALECINEAEFECRSASYDADSGICALSEVGRNVGGRRQLLRMSQSTDLIEVSVRSRPQKLCEFQPTKGRILKTVDSVYQDVEDNDQCRERCLSESFECHSYDFMSAGTKICRLSHHSRASLSHIQEPYINVENTTTYELQGCYQINVECGAREMTARIRTSTLFDGKVYVKSRPNACGVDVENTTSIDLTLPYNDVKCDVIQEQEGLFMSNIVIQHHDMIVTSADVGLALHCKYDLQNATVTNSLLSGLEVKDGIATEYIKETIVASPNVTMTITTRKGAEVPAAQVGDDLALRFEILDLNSPYEISVRSLVAMDGQDNSEILLIDDEGCPVDTSIMGAVVQVNDGKILQSPFQAFKFPASDVVQFRALVTPCLPKCEPILCTDSNVGGLASESYGKRKKRSIEDQSLLLARSVRITDKFSFKESLVKDQVEKTLAEFDDSCASFVSVIISGVFFLISQVVILMIWSYLWHKKRATKHIEPMTGSLPPEVIYGTLSSRNISTSRMTD